MVIQSYTLRCGKALFPYCAESLWWISAPGIPSAPKNHIPARWLLFVGTNGQRSGRVNNSWLFKDETASQWRRQFVLAPASTISNVITTTRFLINDCGYFSTNPLLGKAKGSGQCSSLGPLWPILLHGLFHELQSCNEMKKAPAWTTTLVGTQAWSGHRKSQGEDPLGLHLAIK